MFNTAYEVGGPACAVKTVEQMSGIRMDHYIEVDFTGFKKLIDELGGVHVTTTKPIKDDKSHLRPAGRQAHPQRRAGPRPRPDPARRAATAATSAASSSSRPSSRR